MKRLIVIVAALLTLSMVSGVTAIANSASVCQPNGSGCTKAGTYPEDVVINSNLGGAFKVVWTKSVVEPYSSGVPLYWTAYVTYTNFSSSDQTLACPGDWPDASFVSEHMSGGSGDDGTVPAETTTCSQNPALSVTVPPGGTSTSFATFHNVPWPGSAVAITWGNIGTSPDVYPFGSSSSPPPSKAKPTVLPSDNYAGYAAYPSSGYVVNVQATWSVPSISCPPYGVPRAAAWVGMWGGTTSIKNQTAWLPQIGTVSQCDQGKASYLAFWEMATGVAGQGNAPQILTSVPVHANDTIVASVAFLGPTSFPNGYERRKFEVWIHDTTDNKYALRDVETSAGVPLGSIIRQAGAIIEDEPPCSVWDLPDCSAPIKQWEGHGLAEFSPPVHFSNVFVDALAGAKLPWKYFEYVMKDGKGGSVLAANSPLGLSNGSMHYTITWKTQG
jgi:Peptidase A4 family